MTPQIIRIYWGLIDHWRPLVWGQIFKDQLLGGSLLAGESPWKFSMVRRWWLFCWRLYIFIAVFQRHYTKQFRGNLAFPSIYSIIPNGLFSDVYNIPYIHAMILWHLFSAKKEHLVLTPGGSLHLRSVRSQGGRCRIFVFFCTKYMWEKWSWISAIVKEGSWNSWKVCAWLHWKSFGLAARPTLWSQSVAG